MAIQLRHVSASLFLVSELSLLAEMLIAVLVSGPWKRAALHLAS